MSSNHERVINITYEAVCKDCHGEGAIQGKACNLCGATGYVDIEKRVFITVRPSQSREMKMKLETLKKHFNG
ncbi:MAG: hypothetical protein PHG67_06025 [Bacteroidales bacterium]|jgi:DnaJ-class molecular chaperone|nr:hypothetical protein [Bacteroidales bacterium]HOI31198.1 hypothetical protein [Bacteroidales bacterium]